MRRTTPDLTGRRQATYLTVSRVLLGLTVVYVVWTNYVVFVGGNLPLTPIDLGEGSTGAGLFMLAVGDLIAVLVLWFVLDAALLNLLHLVLRAGGGSRRPIPIPNQAANQTPSPAPNPAGPSPAAPAHSPFAPYPNGGPPAGAQPWNGAPSGAPQGGAGQQDGQQGSTLLSPPGSAWPPPSASGPDGR